MKLFHVTKSESARQIRRSGFRDAKKFLGVDVAGKAISVIGVWFSDQPWLGGGHISDLPRGMQSIIITMPAAQLKKYEVKNADALYREWCIPASLANKFLKR